jgi:hypothetical protein
LTEIIVEASQLLAGDLPPITPFRIVSIEMGSPLLIIAAVPLIVRYGPPLVGLGEQIATSVPRVIRKDVKTRWSAGISVGY